MVVQKTSLACKTFESTCISDMHQEIPYASSILKQLCHRLKLHGRLLLFKSLICS